MSPTFGERFPWRVLVVDDDSHEANRVLEALKRQKRGPIEHVVIDNFEAADEAIQSRYFDAVLVDDSIFATAVRDAGDSPRPFGIDVIDTLRRHAAGTRVVIYTKHFSGDTGFDFSKLVGVRSPNLIGVVDKNSRASEVNVAMKLEPSMRRWREASSLCVEGLSALAESVIAKSPAYDGEVRSVGETERELAYLLGCLFVPGEPRDDPELETRRIPIETVVLSPTSDPGISAAVAYEARVFHRRPETDQQSKPRHEPDAHLLLKVGPPRIVREEAESFDAYVKFGVRFEHRVELLGLSLSNTMGVLCYSFAGGVRGDDLMSLDAVCEGARPVKLGEEALTRLFGASNRNWYGIKGEPTELVAFCQDRLGFEPRRALDECVKSWEKLADRQHAALERWAQMPEAYRGKQPGRIKVARAGRHDRRSCEIGLTSVKFSMPPVELFGEGRLKGYLATQSLVHGDLHAGNVLIEAKSVSTGSGDETVPVFQRACLIDYRSAGYGPRLLDFAQLHASIRFGASRQVGDADIGQSLERAWKWESRLVEETVALLRGANAGPAREPEADWVRLARALDSLMVDSFGPEQPPITVEEYLLTMLLIGVRNLGNRKYSAANRARLGVWVAAMYEAFERERL